MLSFRSFVTACVTLVASLAFLIVPLSALRAETNPADGETAAIETLYRVDRFPRLLPPGTTTKMFSSYDREGGNDDGFSGKWSMLRVHNGNSVLAEMNGAGCIQRIHFSHSGYTKPGLLRRKGEHIRIYLDGSDTPALDVPLEDIFHGKVDGFPKPLAGEGLGGHYCYVPIPYRNGCRVEVDGTFGRFYQLVYQSYPSAEGVVSYQHPPTPKQRQVLEKAVNTWNAQGDLAALGVTDAEKTEETEENVSLESGETFEMKLPAGPRMVRAIYLDVPAESREAAGDVRFQVDWDGAATPAVDVPLDFFFCQALEPDPYRSMFVGVNQRGWYNYLPMPYGVSSTIRLKADKPFEGRLTVVTAGLPEWKGDLGYLHAVYHASLPTVPGKYHPWLDRKGRGHYAGTYLATDGFHPSGLPSWLEGDEVITCDGEWRIPGIGTEDCFNCGWYGVPGRCDRPGTFPSHGFNVYESRKDKYSKAAAYRWNLADPIPYEKSIEAKVEHGPGNDIPVNYRSTAFFYDAAP